jgi:hypothetical protein
MSSDSATALATQQSIKAYVDSQVGTVDTLAEILANGNTTGGTDIAVSTGDDITFADSSKAIFGADSDLQIYHTPTGNHSIIAESGAGNLILAADNLEINNAANNANKIVATTGGAVTLFHNNAAKIATTATGVDITGSATMDGLTVDGTSAEVISVNSTANGSQIAFDSATTSSDWLVGIANDATDDFLIYQGGAGAGDIRLYTDGTERLTVLNGGNVGIGTSSPLATMHLSTTGGGSIYLQDSDATATYNISELSNNAGNFGIQTRDSSGTFVSTDYQIVKNASGADYQRWFTQGSERMRIDSSGNVGIGTDAIDLTSSGRTVVQIEGSSNALLNLTDGTSRLYLHQKGGTSGADIWNSANSYMRFATNDTEVMRIDALGNIGIGETSIGSNALEIRRSGASGIALKETGVAQLIVEQDTDAKIRITNSKNLIFSGGTDGTTERMRIDANGNVGIGTSPSFPLHVSGSSTNYVMSETTGTGTSAGFRLKGDASADFTLFTTQGTNQFAIYDNANSAERMRIDSSGNVGIGTSTNLANGTLNVESNGTSVLQARSDTAGVNDGDTTVVVSRALNSTAGKWANAIYRGYSHAWSYGTNAATNEAMRIDSSGNVGIGTTSPTGLLHLSSSAPAFYMTDTTNNTEGVISMDNAGSLIFNADLNNEAGSSNIRFAVDGTERLRIDSSGNILQQGGSPEYHFGTTSASHYNWRIAAQESVDAGFEISSGTQSAGSDASNDTYTPRFVVKADTGNVGIGTTTVNRKLEVAGNNNAGSKANFIRITDTDTSATAANPQGGIEFYTSDTGNENVTASIVNLYAGSGAGSELTFNTAPNGASGVSERMRIDASGGIRAATGSRFLAASTGEATPDYSFTSDGSMGMYRVPGSLCFSTGGTERMRIDASGNLLVGKTSTGAATAGIELNGANDLLRIARNGGVLQELNRIGTGGTENGDLIEFRVNNAAVGSIACRSSGGNLQIHTNESGIDFGGDGYLPMRGSTITDNSLDIGSSSFRYKDLYRSGSTISTSDRNMKQDERDLTEAETRVAQACKGLLKAFRFIDAVEVDGDDARIHFGIIAQDLQAAFEAEGLDATKYAMFRPSTFTDDEGNEQARLGVCYENLLAFIIAAI